MDTRLGHEKVSTTTSNACQGPTPGGGCPQAPLGGPVICAGRRLLVNTPAGTFTFDVEPGATSCPLAALGANLAAVREPAEPA